MIIIFFVKVKGLQGYFFIYFALFLQVQRILLVLMSRQKGMYLIKFHQEERESQYGNTANQVPTIGGKDRKRVPMGMRTKSMLVICTG